MDIFLCHLFPAFCVPQRQGCVPAYFEDFFTVTVAKIDTFLAHPHTNRDKLICGES